MRHRKSDIINIQKQVDNFRVVMIGEKRVVRMTTVKAKRSNVYGKSLGPSTRCLLKAIERFAKTIDIIWTLRVNEVGEVVSCKLHLQYRHEEKHF